MTTPGRTLLTLAEGRSSVPAWSFSEETGRALLRVGSGEHCNWRVLAGGVQPNHLMLLWNDGKLSVVDVGAPDVRVDGVPLHGSKVIRSARIEFGEAAIVIDSTGPAVEVGDDPPLPTAGPNAKTIILMEPPPPAPASLPTRIALPLPAPADSAPPRYAPAAETRIAPVPTAPPMTDPPAAPVFQLPPEAGDTDSIVTPTGGGTSLPARTWLLLSLTVVGAMLVFTMAGGDAATGDRPAETAQTATAPAADGGPVAAPDSEGVLADAPDGGAAASDTDEQPERDAPVAVPEVVVALDDSAPDPLATAHCRTSKRRSRRTCKPHSPVHVAADLVIAGRYREALARYERLARQHPDDTSYDTMVEVLRQKVAGRCRDGQEPPCREP